MKLTFNTVLKELFDEIVGQCQDGQSKLLFLVYKGAVETSSGKRAHGYKELTKNSTFRMEGNVIIFDDVQDFRYADTICLAKKITGSWSLGSIVVVRTANEGQTFYTQSGFEIGKFLDKDMIAEWVAHEQRLNLLKLAKTESKKKGFDDRLKHSLEDIKRVYKQSDNITKQYIAAKIIYFLNS